MVVKGAWGSGQQVMRPEAVRRILGRVPG